MGKSTGSVNLPPRSNKLMTASSCVGGSLDPRLNQMSCGIRYELIKQFIVTLVDTASY